MIVKYTADEARNHMSLYLICNTRYQKLPQTVKAYGELPENAKINETDAFGEEDGERAFEFGDEGEMDIDDI